uniref:Uncharacterized protein n=1 Tax=Fagus sylvatica TaxID=28930 RepID=A0A2N9FEI9_FAGSY
MAEREISLSRRVRTELHGSVAAVNGWDFSQRSARERERFKGFFLLPVTNLDRGQEQVDLFHFPLPSPPLSLLCGYSHLFFICQ